MWEIEVVKGIGPHEAGTTWGTVINCGAPAAAVAPCKGRNTTDIGDGARWFRVTFGDDEKMMSLLRHQQLQGDVRHETTTLARYKTVAEISIESLVVIQQYTNINATDLQMEYETFF